MCDYSNMSHIHKVRVREVVQQVIKQKGQIGGCEFRYSKYT